jgi:hypothetical protein
VKPGNEVFGKAFEHFIFHALEVFFGKTLGRRIDIIMEFKILE